MADTVLFEAADGVAVMTLNRPERLNALDTGTGEKALALLETVASDASIRVLILTGAGRGFCAGGDMKDFASGSLQGSVPIAHQIGDLRRQMRCAELLHEMRPVTIAAVNGPCAGAGMSWACATDLRFAGESAMFRTAFLGAGLSGDHGGTWLLTNLVGAAKARELYLLGERCDAAEAHRIGLVSKVVPDAELMTFVHERARRLADSAPVALAFMKQNLNDALRLDFQSALALEAERHIRSARTRDHREAAAAFVEGRVPIFEGL